MSASNPENWDGSWHIPILEEHNACPLFTIVVTEISAICYEQVYLKPVLQYVLLCAINFKAICSLLGGTCITLIISWLRTAFDFTLRFSFIPFWPPLLLLWSSALPVPVIFPLLLPSPVPLLSLPHQCAWRCHPCGGRSGKRPGDGSSASSRGSRSVGTSLGAGRFVPWSCSFPDSWRGLDKQGSFDGFVAAC